MKISAARTAAFDVLTRIETERSFTSILLPQFEAPLSDRDRSLCHELVLGTLRRQIYLDRVIEHFAPRKKLDDAVRIALRLGLYQLYFLDRIPAHSAVSESVALVQRARKSSAKSFANAILRRAAAGHPTLSFTDDTDQLSVETSHPRWMLERWARQFGFEKAAAIARGNNIVGMHGFRVIGDVGAEILDGYRASKLVDGCFVAEKIDRTLFELAQSANIYIQDEASQLAATLVDIPAGGRFLDVCAAPGGKTSLIARRHSASTFVAAGDLYGQRVDILRENCLRQAVGDVAVVQYDAEFSLPFAADSFDAVLVDAPCSGTGTIRHNPEIRYFLQPEDFARLSAKQLNILTNASKLVKRGGSLVYSTCSLEVEENEEVIRKFLAEDREFESDATELPVQFSTSDGFARTWPDLGEMDGFFIAKLRRR
jgi:16S rRNA (cytosine967-C5)-methyltransferase